MKFLIYGDLHATDGNEQCFRDTGISLQHYRVEKFFKDICRIYAEQRCDGIIDLGDTTNDRNHISMPTLDLLCAGLSSLPRSKHHYKLTGNHEIYLRNADVSNRRIFEHQFRVITGSEVIEEDGIIFCFCSHTDDHESLIAWISETTKKYADCAKVLFGHFEVVGAKMPSGEAACGIPTKILAPFNVCLLGHIHVPQTIKKRIHYVGSPFQQNWGEAGQNKRVAILDTQTLEVTWIPMLGYPEYRQVNFDQFNATKPGSEHRYRVALKSHEESTAFFKHERFHEAEPVYVYSTEKQPDDTRETTDWTFDGLIDRYLSRVPPKAVGSATPIPDMKELARSIIGGSF